MAGGARWRWRRGEKGCSGTRGVLCLVYAPSVAHRELNELAAHAPACVRVCWPAPHLAWGASAVGEKATVTAPRARWAGLLLGATPRARGSAGAGATGAAATSGQTAASLCCCRALPCRPRQRSDDEKLILVVVSRWKDCVGFQVEQKHRERRRHVAGEAAWSSGEEGGGVGAKGGEVAVCAAAAVYKAAAAVAPIPSGATASPPPARLSPGNPLDWGLRLLEAGRGALCVPHSLKRTRVKQTAAATGPESPSRPASPSPSPYTTPRDMHALPLTPTLASWLSSRPSSCNTPLAGSSTSFSPCKASSGVAPPALGGEGLRALRPRQTPQLHPPPPCEFSLWAVGADGAARGPHARRAGPGWGWGWRLGRGAPYIQGPGAMRWSHCKHRRCRLCTLPAAGVGGGRSLRVGQ